MGGRYNWLRLALCAAGLLISVYLVAVHYNSHVPLLCSGSGLIDCAAVVTSPQSVWFGIPVAVFGALWFAVAGALAAVSLRVEHRAEPAWLRLGAVGWSICGALSVAYLVYVELLVVGRICMWCSAVHVLVLTLFIIAVLSDPARQVAPDGIPAGVQAEDPPLEEASG